MHVTETSAYGSPVKFSSFDPTNLFEVHHKDPTLLPECHNPATDGYK